MVNIAIDSSGVILLSKASILRELCLIADLITTREVEEEVMAGLEKGRTDALYMRELVKEGKIKKILVDKDLVEKFRKDFHLGPGESSIITLSMTRKVPMITDDNKARKIGKILGLDVLSSLDFPVVLYKKAIITYDKAKICLEILKKEGWFGESILVEAFSNLEKGQG